MFRPIGKMTHSLTRHSKKTETSWLSVALVIPLQNSLLSPAPHDTEKLTAEINESSAFI